MPKEVWYIKDNTTGLYIHVYDTDLENCTWGTTLGAHNFETEEAADDAIEAWGETPGLRYIGQNPPPH